MPPTVRYRPSQQANPSVPRLCRYGASIWMGAGVARYAGAVADAVVGLRGSPAVSVNRFWSIVERARASVEDRFDAEEVAQRTLTLLVELPADEVAALAQPLWDLRSVSYQWDLWGAAYLLNGGCSDDGFEYFRGWLIAQGRDVFDRTLEDPDVLANLPSVRRAASADDPFDFECESMYGVVWDAYQVLTGTMDLPEPVVGRYPSLEQTWDFDDEQQVRHRLPRLAALLLD
jgi:hypothetical protein